MKKLMIAAFITAGMMACSENASKEQSTATEENKAGTTDADKRAKEIADSTKMLDKKLADPNDPTTPDSLK